MANYIIEDDFDFWSEVNADVDNENTLCMLTKTPLSDNHVTLPCGHKFNYIGLVKESTSSRVRRKYRSINFVPSGYTKCPYCRKHHRGLILWIPDHDVTHIDGVTTMAKNALPMQQCSYIKKCGKTKGEQCNSCLAYKSKYGVYCRTHLSRIMTAEEQSIKKQELKVKRTSELAALEQHIRNTRPELLKRKVSELKAVLKANNLPVSGTKVILAGRILENDLVVTA
jgi:hypothetical protein